MEIEVLRIGQWAINFLFLFVFFFPTRLDDLEALFKDENNLCKKT